MRARMKVLAAVLLLGAGVLNAQKASAKPAAKGAPKVAPKPKPALYVPDLKLWRLDLSPDLGGWSTDRDVLLRLKLVDPRDPNPPKDEARSYNDYEGDDEGDYRGGGRYRDDSEEDVASAADLRKAREEREAEVKRNAWRQRSLKLWFNGEASTRSLSVGRTDTFALTSQNGENRLEILEPDSGLRIVRSWWVSTSRTRLRILSVQRDGEYASGSMQILEPDGAIANQGQRTPSGGRMQWSDGYSHDTPPPGTYTVKWTGGWRGGKPARVRVEVLLDAGTDQERRWTMERLMLPGAGAAILGTFDVEP